MIGDTGVFNKTWSLASAALILALVGASEFECAESSTPAAKNGQTD